MGEKGPRIFKSLPCEVVAVDSEALGLGGCQDRNFKGSVVGGVGGHRRPCI